MGKSCAIIPQVKNKNGQIVDSRLFKDLLSYTDNNREETIRIYQITKSSDFITKWIPRLVVDDNNEPTLNSLLKNTNLNKIIPENKVLEKLNREIGFYKKGTNKVALIKNTDSKYKELIEKAIKFNTTHTFKDDYVARVVNVMDRESDGAYINVQIFKRTLSYSIEANKMIYNKNLNEKLRNILASYGISIGALTELEKRMGINGVTDFDKAKLSAEGLIELIRLAEGEQGEKALPEEFAHFIIEAIGDNSLLNRLLNLLNTPGVTEEILGSEYDVYKTLYENDSLKLVKEAAGKLLAQHLLKAEQIPNKPYKSILSRLIDYIKNFFRGLSISQLKKAIVEADKEFDILAKNILEGNINNVNINNISTSNLFYQTNERIQRDKKLLKSIIDNELKRLKIYEKRNPNSSFDVNQQILINRLELELAENNEIEGIYIFLENALDKLQKLSTKLSSINSNESMSVKDKASLLRDIKNYIYSYSNIIKDIRIALVNEEKYQDNRYGERVKIVLENSYSLIENLSIEFNNASTPLFLEFLKPFLGKNLIIPFGKNKGKKIKAEELITMADEDISFFDRWLDSMADSSDYMLKIIDQAVKNSKEKSRLRTIDLIKDLQAATIKLENAGILNTDWMFERDSKGNLSGNYISEINHSLFKEKMKEMFQMLNTKYGKNPIGENALKYNKERRKWFADNMEIIDGKRVPKMSIYRNSIFDNLHDSQKEYYNKVMSIKEELDALLPDKSTTLFNAVKIRKDLIERIKNSKDIKNGSKQIWESIKDNFIRRSDDVDFNDKFTVLDFDKREVRTLPIYYTKLKEGESNNDISTDITSTLSAYAAMVYDFDEMNKVIDVLELGRDLLREREIIQTQGGKPLIESFKSMGRKVENSLTKEGDSTKFMQRLNDFFEMQVYGKYMADEGTFGKTDIDKGKVANFVNRVTSLNSLALNILSGISNIITGRVMMRIESVSGEFFTQKNSINADRIYGTALPEYLAEIGSRIKTNKLSLWNELFNTMQEYEQDVSSMNFDRKSWYSKMFNTSTLFFINNAGEHWMQSRTSLALADAYKMKSPDGKVVSLWEAMEVVPIDGNNKKSGAKLIVKSGYTKLDGTKFTKEDIIKFSRKSAAINQRMHGIYNKIDRSAIQRLAIGRMGMMFRKWIKPSLNRRFKSITYNYDLDSWTEGYYRTAGRFLLQLARDLRESQFNIASRWNELTTTEKFNIKRAIVEVSHFLAVAMIIGLIEWSDDKDRPWLIKMIEYQSRRLYTELGAMIPGKSMITEGLRIIKSPAAGINTIEDMLNLTKLLNPWNYTDEIQSGRYEGHSTAYKSFFESPIIPMNKTIYRSLNPEETIPFYKQ